MREHNCRPEPHCTCGENAWYHRDTDDDGSAECAMVGCDCRAYDRCHEFDR